MLGGIIGDLAASTYLRNPECFYRQLIDDKATLSEYSLSILVSYVLRKGHERDFISQDKAMEIRNVYFKQPKWNAVSLSYEAKFTEPADVFPWGILATGTMLNSIATEAYLSDSELGFGKNIAFGTNWEKEGGYAWMFLSKMIYYLRHGKTKDEIYEILGNGFSSMRKSWNWHEEEGPCCLLLRAWDCFYNSHDFGSAIHNAVRYPNSYTRQIASLVGLIAEAMYGCNYYFIKEKFSQNGQTRLDIEIPKAVYEAYPEELKSIRSDYMKNRIFFRKNDALTNVERHTFIPGTSHYEGLTLSPDSYQKVIFAFYTDWDNRYGFYLDNGWIYCYRSGYNLGRFRFIMQDKRYVVTDVQQTGDLPNGINLEHGLVGAFHSCRIPEVS